MSRLAKEVKVAGKNITVFEMTVKDIKKLWGDLTGTNMENSETSLFSNDQLIRTHWDKCVHGITLEESEDLTPSELKVIYDAFSEVNAVFFDLSLKLEGENPLLTGLREAIMKDLMRRYVASLPPDTMESGTMDTVSS